MVNPGYMSLTILAGVRLRSSLIVHLLQGSMLAVRALTVGGKHAKRHSHVMSLHPFIFLGEDTSVPNTVCEIFF